MPELPSPERSGARIRYMPALDGLRAIALLVVLGFHGGFTFIHGGYLPLTSFFVLSGFLITALLLAERSRTNGTGLTQFWVRRARRLVPAAIIGIGLATVYVQLAGDRVSTNARGDGFAALFWVANWRFIITGQTYADTFSDPSPFQHYWSLAVEEQFYLFLPLVFVAAIGLARGRRWLFGGFIAALTAASVLWMAHLHQPGDAPLRAYFGTDTRGAELLVGVLLALVMVDRRGVLRQFSGVRSHIINSAGAIALALSVALWFITREYDDRLYEGGLLGIAALAALVVVAATQPRSMVTRLLSWSPLAWIGRMSYGIYLYHWPIFLYLNEQRTGLDTAPLFVARMALTMSLAWLSLRYVENPIRQGTTPKFVGSIGWANATVAAAAVVAAFVTTATPLVTLTTGAQEGELPPPPPITVPHEVAAAVQLDDVPRQAVDLTTSSTGPTPSTTLTSDTATSAPTPTAAPTTAAPTTTATTTPPPLRVMVVGDSVGRNLATGLQRWAAEGADIVVYDATIQGCTISRGGVRILDNGRWKVPDSCGFWATGDLDQRLAEFAPDMVVVHSGINELYDREHPSWTGAMGPGAGVFDSFIRQEWASAAAEYGATGALVMWANLPCVNADLSPGAISRAEADRRVDIFNASLLPAVTHRAQIIDFRGYLCPNGFTTTVEGISNARADGFHISDDAAGLVARNWLGPRLLQAAGR